MSVVRMTAGTVMTLALAASGWPGSAYDPLAAVGPVTHVDLVVRDASRNRDVPLRAYLPVAMQPAPVILFSHGLGGSREGSSYLGEHWAGRGYVGVFLQHPGSDASVWREAPPGERYRVLQKAASPQNLVARVEDVHAVLDQLEKWSRADGHPLLGRLDLARVGMAGHSFGAITTQYASGESLGRLGRRFTDDRIRAAIALSPSSPRRGDAAAAFSSVSIPWMLMTGTRDTAPIGDIDVASRLAVFPALPPGDKYEVVLAGAEHSAFGDRALPGEGGSRNPNHHRAVLALSTAFWDAYLRRDPAALAWLRGSGQRSVLEKDDRWQTK